MVVCKVGCGAIRSSQRSLHICPCRTSYAWSTGSILPRSHRPHEPRLVLDVVILKHRRTSSDLPRTMHSYTSDLTVRTVWTIVDKIKMCSEGLKQGSNRESRAEAFEVSSSTGLGRSVCLRPGGRSGPQAFSTVVFLSLVSQSYEQHYLRRRTW